MSTKKLQLAIVEKTYRVNGKELAAAIEAAGLTQSEIAEEAGYKGSSRISHLCRVESTEVAGSSLAPLLTVLHNAGVRIEGFDWSLAGVETSST